MKPGHFEFSNSVTEVTAWPGGNPMRPLFWMGLIASVLLMADSVRAKPQQEKEPLRLVQKIPLTNVKGRIDHMEVDVKGKRLFVAGLENGTLEVVDLKDGK